MRRDSSNSEDSVYFRYNLSRGFGDLIAPDAFREVEVENGVRSWLMTSEGKDLVGQCVDALRNPVSTYPSSA
jgi:hypothetical protein